MTLALEMWLHYSKNCDKLSLVGMQLPGKYQENFDVRTVPTKGLHSKRRNSTYIFQVVASPTNESLLLFLGFV